MQSSKILFLYCLLLMLCLCQAVPLHAAAPASPFVVEIADVGKSAELAALLSGKGLTAVIPAKNIWVVDQQSNCAVWIGKNVPLETLRVVLPEAMAFNPFLEFFYLVGDRGELPPERVGNTVHIGGSIEAALVKKLNVIDRKELLATLNRAKTLDELHRFLHDRNVPAALSSSTEPTT